MSKVSKAYHAYLEPLFAKIAGSEVTKEAFDLAKQIIPQVTLELLHQGKANPDNIIAVVKARVKEVLDAKYPGQAFFINIAVDFAFEHLKDQFVKKV